MKDPFQQFRTAFRTFSSRNYRLFFVGQAVSQIGTWIQTIALSWLVYRLTHSAFMLGMVGFTSRMPGFLLAPLAGVAADHWPRLRLMRIVQVLFMLQATVLAVLVLSGAVQVWHILVLGGIAGVIQSLDIPVRQSFVVELVERKEDLGNAIALNSVLINLARLVGPALAGILIALVGEGWCFTLNAASFLAILFSLYAMRITTRPPARTGHGAMRAFAEGWRYVFGFAPVRSVLLLLAVVCLMGMPYQVLMPVFAKDVLHGGAHSLGFLMSAVGIGALAGAFTLAARRSPRGLGRNIVFAAALFGAALVGFAFSRTFWLSWAILVLVGFGMLVQITSCNTVLQTLVDDGMRGRVMSFYSMVAMGALPFGNLLGGSLAHVVGAPVTVAMGGGVCLLAAAYAAFRLPAMEKLVHPIYDQKEALALEEIGTGG